MQAHRLGSSVAVFLVTGSELWVDVTKSSTSKAVTSAFKKSKSRSSTDGGPSSTTTSTHWMAESGILDLFVFLGPSPTDIYEAYSALTGKAPMPLLSALGYHQCRWNYLDEQDVLSVQQRFDDADVPLDFVWLDIEYSAEHMYFLWDRRNFPTPEKMQHELAARGRKVRPPSSPPSSSGPAPPSAHSLTPSLSSLPQLVAIVDPHHKRSDDYYVFTEAKELDILCKQPDGKTDFEGWCWSGSSAWVDWFNPASHEWWSKLFSFDKFKVRSSLLFSISLLSAP